MNHFYLDASALVKRYIVETGSPLTNHRLDNVIKSRLMALYIGIGEVTSVIVRRHNEDSIIRASLDLIERHSINATDAIVLCSALEVANALRNAGDDLVLIASDLRLIRAAQAEGLVTFNPELDTQMQLDALIAG